MEVQALGLVCPKRYLRWLWERAIVGETNCNYLERLWLSLAMLG